MKTLCQTLEHRNYLLVSQKNCLYFIHISSTQTALDILLSTRYNRNYVLVTPFYGATSKVFGREAYHWTSGFITTLIVIPNNLNTMFTLQLNSYSEYPSGS